MRRFPWRLFGLLIAVPALVLAWFGLRAVRAERLEAEQQLRDQQTHVARLADAAILNVLTAFEGELPRPPLERPISTPSVPADVPLLEFHRSGIVTFPRDRVYFGPFGRRPSERERLTAWSAPLTVLIEQAQTAEAQGRRVDVLALLQRIGRAEPRLQAWADIVSGRLRLREGEVAALAELTNTDWSRSPAVTPSGLPAALVACSISEEVGDDKRRGFAPLIEATLAALREGRWWLSADERRFHDAQLRTLLLRASGTTPPPDARVDHLADIEQIVRQSPPSRRNQPMHSLERGAASTFLLIWVPARADAEAWNGVAISQDRAGPLFGPSLERLFAGQAFSGAIRDSTGAAVWRSAPDERPSWHAEPLQAIEGWELAFSGPVDVGGITGRQWLWYGFVLLMLIVLLAALGMTTHTVRREVELARQQTDFVAAVTHEFKSPITGIRLLLERMAGGRTASADAAAYCGAIGQETARLERLVNRLLEAQQIDAGRRQYRCVPGSLEEVAAEAIQHVQPVADGKRIRIELRVDRPVPPVLMERASIADAIENLVDNAIKYSPARTRVVVRIHMDAERACVDVEDEGIGIDRDEIPLVFNKFYRGRRGDRQNVRGTGLGLALVKAAAEAHGGSVDVSSEPGVGSRFSLRLPA